MERYANIKQHATPPMARLVGGQCGGCYMSLPSVTLKQIQTEGRIVECDNCGRILYLPPEG
jgi:predicted  nucleic acid-binding Zn-ribbon protein